MNGGLTASIHDRCSGGSKKPMLTASDVSLYSMSPFGLHSRHFADPAEKDPADGAQEYFEGHRHAIETGIKSRLYRGVPDMGDADTFEWFMVSLELMASGVDAALGCQLVDRGAGMMGSPDIIERVRGKSAFGGHRCRIKEIEPTRHIRPHHILHAAFHNRLLGGIQGHTPATFSIIDGGGIESRYEYAEHEDGLADAMRGTAAVLEGLRPTPTYGPCPYPWSGYNDRTAVMTRDISCIMGTGARRKEALARHGITTLDGLLGAGTGRLCGIGGIAEPTAAGYVAGAGAIITGKPVRKDGGSGPAGRSETEVFFDFDGIDAEGGHAIYLIGMAVRSGEQAEYESFTAGAGGEARAFCDFLDRLDGLGGCAAYHWNNYGRTHVLRMPQAHGIEEDAAAPLMADGVMRDLHNMAARMHAFPVPGTGIRDIAGWMGFQWRHADMGDLGSAMAYLRHKGDRESGTQGMRKAVDRSRDNCEAMLAVKGWLETAGRQAQSRACKVTVTCLRV